MDTVEHCIQNIADRCSLLNCLMGFNGPVDPAPIGYGRDEIEVIATTFGTFDFCTQILDSAVEAGLIPEYKSDDNGNPGGDDGNGGNDGGDNGGTDDGNGNPVTTDQTSNFPLIPIGALAWLLTST